MYFVLPLHYHALRIYTNFTTPARGYPNGALRPYSSIPQAARRFPSARFGGTVSYNSTRNFPRVGIICTVRSAEGKIIMNPKFRRSLSPRLRRLSRAFAHTKPTASQVPCTTIYQRTMSLVRVYNRYAVSNFQSSLLSPAAAICYELCPSKRS